MFTCSWWYLGLVAQRAWLPVVVCYVGSAAQSACLPVVGGIWVW